MNQEKIDHLAKTVDELEKKFRAPVLIMTLVDSSVVSLSSKESTSLDWFLPVMSAHLQALITQIIMNGRQEIKTEKDPFFNGKVLS